MLVSLRIRLTHDPMSSPLPLSQYITLTRAARRARCWPRATTQYRSADSNVIQAAREWQPVGRAAQRRFEGKMRGGMVRGKGHPWRARYRAVAGGASSAPTRREILAAPVLAFC